MTGPNILHDKVQKTDNTSQQLPQAGNPPIGTVTSSFFVSIDDLFQISNVGDGTSKNAADLKNAVQLLWFTSVEERVSQGNMTSDYQSSGTLMHSLLEMHVQTDSSMPSLRQNLRGGDPVKKIIITRVGHYGKDKDNTTIYSSTFTNCFLESIEEFPDKSIIKARVNTRSDKAASTDYDGTVVPAGAASGWDYTQNTAIA